MLTPTEACDPAVATQAAQVTLAFSDGVEHELTVAPGRSVLETGLEAGLPLLYQCRSGMLQLSGHAGRGHGGVPARFGVIAARVGTRGGPAPAVHHRGKRRLPFRAAL